MKRALWVIAAAALAAGCGGTAAGKIGGRSAKGEESGPMRLIAENTRCQVGKDREVLVDLNQDGNADVRKIYAKHGDSEVIVCREADLNFDGNLDIFVYFDEQGAIKRDELDLDYDGLIDIISLYAAGKVVKQELDTNSDHRVDRVRVLVDNVPTRVEGDTNADGKVDYWEFYEGGRLVRVGMDVDKDGRADVWNRDDAEPPADAAQGAEPKPEEAPETEGK
jgi:hypothetical protein